MQVTSLLVNSALQRLFVWEEEQRRKFTANSDPQNPMVVAVVQPSMLDHLVARITCLFISITAIADSIIHLSRFMPRCMLWVIGKIVQIDVSRWQPEILYHMKQAALAVMLVFIGSPIGIFYPQAFVNLGFQATKNQHHTGPLVWSRGNSKKPIESPLHMGLSLLNVENHVRFPDDFSISGNLTISGIPRDSDPLNVPKNIFFPNGSFFVDRCLTLSNIRKEILFKAKKMEVKEANFTNCFSVKINTKETDPEAKMTFTNCASVIFEIENLTADELVFENCKSVHLPHNLNVNKLTIRNSGKWGEAYPPQTSLNVREDATFIGPDLLVRFFYDPTLNGNLTLQNCQIDGGNLPSNLKAALASGTETTERRLTLTNTNISEEQIAEWKKPPATN